MMNSFFLTKSFYLHQFRQRFGKRWFSSSLIESHLTSFQKILESKEGSILLSDSAKSDELIRYNQDWTKKYFGKSRIVLKPSSTEEVSEVLAYCQKHSIGVVPQGGNTSLVGGAISLYDEDVIVSLERMNKIIYHDSVGGILTCEAGCILQDLESYLHEHTYCTLPYDLGAKGSCQIGGNIATNAGGLRLVRYGNLHGLVLGLEVVLPNGQILRQNMISFTTPSDKTNETGSGSQTIHTSLRKDNTGYDLKQLFIGSEGTLGIITKVSIHTPPAPLSQNVTLLTLNSEARIQDIADIFLDSKKRLNEILSAFEFWDDDCHALVDHYLNTSSSKDQVNQEKGRNPNQKYILIETMGSYEAHDDEKLLNFLEEQMQLPLITATTSPPTAVPDKTMVEDGVMAKDLSEVKQLWSRRELIPLAAGSHPETIVVLKYDLSLPQIYMYEPIVQTRQRLEQWWENLDKDSSIQSNDVVALKAYFLVPRAIGFGHFGDGNIHLNVLLRKRIRNSDDSVLNPEQLTRQKELTSLYKQLVLAVIEPWVYDQIYLQWQGSISAEHGIGIQKTSYLPSIKSSIEFEMMQALKKIFDPNEIMNRGKLFPFPSPSSSREY